MPKFYCLIFLTILTVSCFAFFSTEYALVDSISEEWQQVG